jgi:hypothetical protein
MNPRPFGRSSSRAGAVLSPAAHGDPPLQEIHSAMLRLLRLPLPATDLPRNRLSVHFLGVWLGLLLVLLLVLAGLPVQAQVGEEYRIELVIFEHAPAAAPLARAHYVQPWATPTRPRFTIGEGPYRPSLEGFALEAVAQRLEESGAGRVLARLAWDQVGRDLQRTPWLRVQEGRFLGYRASPVAPQPHSLNAPGASLEPQRPPIPGSPNIGPVRDVPMVPAVAGIQVVTGPSGLAPSVEGEDDPPHTLPADTGGWQLLDTAQEVHELQGGIRVWVGQFLHLETQLLFHWQPDLNLRTPVPGTLADNAATVPPADFVVFPIPIQGRQRMNSGEALHYLDHPVIGIIARATRLPRESAVPSR